MVLSCRGALTSGDTTHFQYDVAEIKLGMQKRPQWILDLQASGQHLLFSSASRSMVAGASLASIGMQ